MKENKNCTLIKTKDLEALRELANSKKPEFIEIRLFENWGHISPDFRGSINLDLNLQSQILNIKKAAIDIARKNFEANLNDKVDREIRQFADRLLRHSRRKIQKQLLKIRDE